MLKDIYKLADEYSAMVAEAQPVIDALDAKKKELAMAVMEYGDNVEHGNVVATIKSESVRTSWDGKALSGYAAAHPEIKEFQKNTTVKATVAIKVK